MKLFVWHPSGHGQYTFSVVAKDQDKAWAIIDRYIKSKHTNDPMYGSEFNYVADGWGTDYYKLQVFEIGQVFEHDND
jgi:starvation-inducible outer membrane lipoprotein